MVEDAEIEKIVDAVLRAIEEKEKRKEEEERKRAEYVKKIWKYFPGAKTKKLSFEEVKEIAEKLEDLANRVEYTPTLPKQAKTTFFGKKKWRKIAFLAFLIGILVTTIAIKISIWGW